MGGIISNPANLELKRPAVIQGAIMRNNEVNVELIIVKEAKFLGGGRSAKERR